MKKMEFHPYQIKVINVPPVIGEKLELMTKRHSGNNISGEIHFLATVNRLKKQKVYSTMESLCNSSHPNSPNSLHFNNCIAK
jgi:hypothetical protein